MERSLLQVEPATQLVLGQREQYRFGDLRIMRAPSEYCCLPVAAAASPKYRFALGGVPSNAFNGGITITGSTGVRRSG